MNVQSLARMAESALLDKLRRSLRVNSRSATFACGGKIYFDSQTDGQHQDSHSVSERHTTAGQRPTEKAGIEPIQIRFGESGQGIKVIFPPSDGTSDPELEQLISACEPATFGRGGDEVMDENYRKAGKLDEADFATSFCPYKSGIVDIVSQLLSPQLKHDMHTRSIKAELYKLNVYSAPTGKFKAHVDTPRSERQIGSLVVALPVDHEGGELAVRKAGQEMLFDWSISNNTSEDGTTNPPCIQWAAFYSDCEHEVYEVTAGHRVTLTYNLYVARGEGHLAGATTALDPTQLPLFGVLDGALRTPGFMTHGRVLAIYLTHSYAHTHKSLNFLPEGLKGADWSLYETAHALGLKCKLVSIHSREDSNDYYERTRHYADSAFPEFFFFWDLEEDQDYDWGKEMPTRKITWLNSYRRETEEPQTAYIAYGNQPSLDVQYSQAAMLIRIPPFMLRGAEDAEMKSVYADVKRDERSHEYSDEEDRSDEDSVSDESDP